MSQENVEIVRAVFEAWNARDMEALFAHFHPELVYHPRADEPDPSPHVGRDAYERLVYGFVDSFSEVTVEVLELIDAGDHVIASTVLHAVLRGQGSASGAGVSDYVRLRLQGCAMGGWSSEGCGVQDETGSPRSRGAVGARRSRRRRRDPLRHRRTRNTARARLCCEVRRVVAVAGGRVATPAGGSGDAMGPCAGLPPPPLKDGTVRPLLVEARLEELDEHL